MGDTNRRSCVRFVSELLSRSVRWCLSVICQSRRTKTADSSVLATNRPTSPEYTGDADEPVTLPRLRPYTRCAIARKFFSVSGLMPEARMPASVLSPTNASSGS